MIRLAIIEDNLTYLNALKMYMQKTADIDVVHTANNLQNLPALYDAVPDVVIMDIDLGADSGIKGVKLIKEAMPQTGVFMLTVFDDKERIFNSIQAGASGYLLKKDPPLKIADAVRSVYNGEGVINGHIAKTLLNALPPVITPPSVSLDSYALTKREKEVMQLLVDGLSYKEIASQCFISMATLNSHIRNLYDKLGVHTRAEIAAKFHGLQAKA